MADFLLRGPTFSALVCYIFFVNAIYPRNDCRAKSWALRILFGAAAIAVATTLDYLWLEKWRFPTMLEPLLCIATCWCYGLMVLKMKPGPAFYASVLAALLGESFGMLIHMILGMLVIGNQAFRLAAILLILLALAMAAAVLIRQVALRRVIDNGELKVSSRKLLHTTLILVIYQVLANYQLIFWLMGGALYASMRMVLSFRVVLGFAAALLIIIQGDIELQQRSQQELAVLSQMLKRQQEQFQMSRNNIDIINRKCHDLKHQMEALKHIQDQAEIHRQVTEMESAVMIYDAVVRTGNSALDVVLSEKSLFCDAHQINMTCLVDGKLLDFISVVDLYTLFGNALDNAIESVMKQKDKQKRVIQVAAYEERDMLLIRIRNYCDMPPKIEGDLPLTTKEDTEYHGFGLKSIRHIAEKYGGGISIQTGSNFFALQVLIPMS